MTRRRKEARPLAGCPPQLRKTRTFFLRTACPIPTSVRSTMWGPPGTFLDCWEVVPSSKHVRRSPRSTVLHSPFPFPSLFLPIQSITTTTTYVHLYAHRLVPAQSCHRGATCPFYCPTYVELSRLHLLRHGLGPLHTVLPSRRCVFLRLHLPPFYITSLSKATFLTLSASVA